MNSLNKFCQAGYEISKCTHTLPNIVGGRHNKNHDLTSSHDNHTFLVFLLTVCIIHAAEHHHIFYIGL